MCNLLWLLVLFSVYELLKQDSPWGGPCRMAPEGFRHHCFSHPEGEKSQGMVSAQLSSGERKEICLYWETKNKEPKH